MRTQSISVVSVSAGVFELVNSDVLIALQSAIILVSQMRVATSSNAVVSILTRC